MSTPRRGPLLAPLYGGFFLVGTTTVLLGPLIPELSPIWGVSNAEAAALFVAQFATSSLGAILSSFHLRRSLVVGYALMALGLGTLAIGSWPIPIGAMAIVGLGLGLAIPATNLEVAYANPENRGAALSTLNLLWGLGATLCPLAFAALRGRASPTAAVLALTVLVALTGIWLAAVLRATDPAALDAEPTQEAAARRSRWLELGLSLLVAAMFFLYVGIETAIGGWVVAFADQLGDRPGAASMLVGTCFWGALLTGRAVAPKILSRISERTLYAAAVAVATVGAGAILTAGSRVGVALGAAVAGLGLAPIFPLTVSLLAEQTATTRSRGTGWVFSFTGFGGAALPWLTGRLTGDSETLRGGFFVPLAGLIVLAVVIWIHHTLSHRKAAVAT